MKKKLKSAIKKIVKAPGRFLDKVEGKHKKVQENKRKKNVKLQSNARKSY